MKPQHYFVEATSIPSAWQQVVARLCSPGVEEIVPLVVNINIEEGKPVDDPVARKIVDDALAKRNRELGKEKLFSCGTTANTIFPNSIWSPRLARDDFFARYKRLLPRLKKCTHNRMGIYFERLVDFGDGNNQLKHMLDSWDKGNRRRSEFQAITVDPSRDQSDAPLRGFPCLRQVMFIPTEEGLMVSGIYGVQYIFDRAYGNYLGLYHLGRFMAHEMKLPLVRLQCVTSIAQLGSIGKTKIETTAHTLLGVLELHSSEATPSPVIEPNVSTKEELHV